MLSINLSLFWSSFLLITLPAFVPAYVFFFLSSYTEGCSFSINTSEPRPLHCPGTYTTSPFFLPSHVNNYLPAPKTMDPIASDPTLLFLAIQVHFKQLSRALLDRPLHCDRHYPFSFQALRTSVSVQSLLGSRGHLLQMNGLSSHWVSPPSSFPESSNKELGWSNFSTLVSCSFAFVSFFL